MITRTYRVTGAVQGVGFRPFVFRVAQEMGLAGWVRNDAHGVIIQATGSPETLDRFERALRGEAPAPASVREVRTIESVTGGTAGPFLILDSENDGAATAQVLPDLATCPDCLDEILNPAERRYRYPFTNCTRCGPRFSILLRIPYDRPNTTMAAFTMCPACRAEYENPADRRFHAQPIACPACGPQLAWWSPGGAVLAERDAALEAAIEALRQGRVVAVKGLGGFHLMVDARADAAVRRLRDRKHREEKPLALMYPALEALQRDCEVSSEEKDLLLSPAAPIVLLRRRTGANLAASVAPGNPYLGAMLPYTPLHHLLLRALNAPVVATSGNLSDEPICTDEHEALERLRDIAEGFLVHNRPIARHVDDSVARVLLGAPQILRRARGYAPAPITLSGFSTDGLSAVGAHLKNTVAVAHGSDVMLSQHLGDLETPQARDAFREARSALEQLFTVTPQMVVCDLHPEYASTLEARAGAMPVRAVQHHHAHVAACMAEHGLDGEVLGVVWDGSGYGADGTLWGGEFLRSTRAAFQRVAHLRTFRLPGGDAAAREPRRTALSLLFELFGPAVFSRTDLAPVQTFSPSERAILQTLLERGYQAPLTSSVGRLFDAVASLVGLRQINVFEGQAAMELEFALDGCATDEAYPAPLSSDSPRQADWGPMIAQILADTAAGVSPCLISARFHNTLAAWIVQAARQVGLGRVVLTGGCFQNRYLTERAVRALRQAGFEAYWHQQVPPNDGGIALGQMAVVGASIVGENTFGSSVISVGNFIGGKQGRVGGRLHGRGYPA